MAFRERVERLVGMFEGGGEEIETDFNLSGGEAQGRAEAEGAGSAREQEESATEGEVDQEVAEPGGGLAVLVDLDADHEAEAADFVDDRVAGGEVEKAGLELPTSAKGVGHVFGGDEGESFEGGRAGDGVAAECGSVAAGGPIHDAGGGDDRAQGEAVGDSLGQAEDVGVDAPVFAGEELAGASEAGLNLVDHEQNAVFIAEPAEAGEEGVGGDEIAALALDGFDENGGELVRGTEGAEEGADAFEVTVAGVMDFGEEGAKAAALDGFGGCQ